MRNMLYDLTVKVLYCDYITVLYISISIGTRLLKVRFSLGKHRFNILIILYINDDSICVSYLNSNIVFVYGIHW